MKRWTTWLAGLGIAGACLMLTGCGGGDVPDASSEGQAASGNVPDPGVAQAPAAAPIDGAKVAQADETPKTEEESATPAAAAAPAQAEPKTSAPPADEETAAAPKPEDGKGNSNTAEMLAMATGPAAGGSGDAAPGGSSAPAGGPSGATPGAPGAGGPVGAMQGMTPGGGMPGGRGGAPGMPGMPMAGGPGMPAAGGPGAMGGRMPGGMPGMPGMGPRGPGMGGSGGPGGLGGPGQQDSGPADFRSPEGAVKAFLAALKAKDLDRLNEATALLRQVESSSAKSQELFKKIFDLSLSDSELDQLAEALNGYTISGENPPKSTGRVEVILRKAGSSNGSYFLRKVTVRHEKKGWGVLDVAGEMEFKPMNMIPNRRGTGRRR